MVPENAINYPKQPLWYLPHHPVFNPNKPERSVLFFIVQRSIVEYHLTVNCYKART